MPAWPLLSAGPDPALTCSASQGQLFESHPCEQSTARKSSVLPRRTRWLGELRPPSETTSGRNGAQRFTSSSTLASKTCYHPRGQSGQYGSGGFLIPGSGGETPAVGGDAGTHAGQDPGPPLGSLGVTQGSSRHLLGMAAVTPLPSPAVGVGSRSRSRPSAFPPAAVPDPRAGRPVHRCPFACCASSAPGAVPASVLPETPQLAAAGLPRCRE